MTKYWLIFLALLGGWLFIPSLASAHPGSTDTQGCHTCTKNCGFWGVSWTKKHCHIGGTTRTKETHDLPQSPDDKKPLFPTPTPAATHARKVMSPKIVNFSSDTGSTELRTQPTACLMKADNYCSPNCNALNDSDCCTNVEGQIWLLYQGCFQKQEIGCQQIQDNYCPTTCLVDTDPDCSFTHFSQYRWDVTWSYNPQGRYERVTRFLF